VALGRGGGVVCKLPTGTCFQTEMQLSPTRASAGEPERDFGATARRWVLVMGREPDVGLLLSNRFPSSALSPAPQLLIHPLGLMRGLVQLGRGRLK
jgi:hypothetical protein